MQNGPILKQMNRNNERSYERIEVVIMSCSVEYVQGNAFVEMYKDDLMRDIGPHISS